MNKGEIRTRILEQVDWNPNQSTDFKGKVDRLINRAYQQLSLEAPFLFFEEECRIITRADTTSDSSNVLDVLAVVTTDKYVLQRSYASAASVPAWIFNGTWDSRMIEVTRSDGTLFRRRIREVWTEDDGQGNTLDRISIEHEWPNNSDTGLTYRIYDAAYELPADVVELRSARLWADTHYPLEVMSQNDMEKYEYIDYQGTESGRPYRIFRGRHWQIDAPNKSPVVSLRNEDMSWQGPQPVGQFDFCYTYIWGNRELDVKAPSGLLEPRWESAPSPVSDKITASSESDTITIGLPNIDQELNFYLENSAGTVVTPPRSKRSGLRKRLYLRRYSVSALSKATTVNEIETPEIFFLLDEIKGHTTEYVVNGSKIPDYYRRLKRTHGYQSIRFWPIPDNSYEVDCRVLRRPQPLYHDNDAPRIHAEACDLLIQKSLSMFYEMSGQHDVAQVSSGRYQDILLTLTKRYGQIAGLRPRKKYARVMRGVREVRVIYKP